MLLQQSRTNSLPNSEYAAFAQLVKSALERSISDQQAKQQAQQFRSWPAAANTDLNAAMLLNTLFQTSNVASALPSRASPASPSSLSSSSSKSSTVSGTPPYCAAKNQQSSSSTFNHHISALLNALPDGESTRKRRLQEENALLRYVLETVTEHEKCSENSALLPLLLAAKQQLASIQSKNYDDITPMVSSDNITQEPANRHQFRSVSELRSDSCTPSSHDTTVTNCARPDFGQDGLLALASTLSSNRYWSEDEHTRFVEGVRKYGAHDHKAIAAFVGTRTSVQARSHGQKFFKKLNKAKVNISPSKLKVVEDVK